MTLLQDRVDVKFHRERFSRLTHIQEYNSMLLEYSRLHGKFPSPIPGKKLWLHWYKQDNAAFGANLLGEFTPTSIL
jgi:hypothetical protein